MKKLFIIGMLLTLSASAFSEDKKLIKTCSTVLSMPGETTVINAKIEIFQKNKNFTSTVTQTTSDGQTSSVNDVAQVTEFLAVQEGLTGNLEQDIDKLNLAESLVTHALSLTEDPIFEHVFDAGMDLRKVRSAKVYVVSKPTHMGLTAIVEARDAEGRELGSFFGGFLVGACK